MMQRLILHWTAGRYLPSHADTPHYHFLIDGFGTVREGLFPPEANAAIRDGIGYAAHTRGCNTGSIGIALCAMHEARERPFDSGDYPIRPEQVDALAGICARLCRQYGIPVTRTTVLSHAEVQPTLGIEQRGKWDIAWLPGMERPGDPVEVGDRLRAMIRARMQPDAELTFTPEHRPEGWWHRVLAHLGL